MGYYDEHSRGSARFATRAEIQKAGLLNGVGPGIGWIGKERLSAPSGHITLVAATGAGKGTGITIPMALGHCGVGQNDAPNMIWLDPKNEIYEATADTQVRYNRHCVSFAPHKPNSVRLNPLEDIDPHRPDFDARCKRAAEDMLPVATRGDGKHWEEISQIYLALFTKGIAWENKNLPDNYVTLPLLTSFVRRLEQGGITRLDALADLGTCGLPEVESAAAELSEKASDPSNREWPIVMTELRKALIFMSDEAVARSVSPPYNLSYREFHEGPQPIALSIGMPADAIRRAPQLIRRIFSCHAGFQERHPLGRKTVYLIEETAQLGNFQEVLNFYSIGRGYGIIVVTVWQNFQQMDRVLGTGAKATILANTDHLIIFKIADPETAKYISDRMGSFTLKTNDILSQEKATAETQNIIWDVLNGSDPIDAFKELRRQKPHAEHQDRFGRLLMTPDELEAMPPRHMLIFSPGLRPIRAEAPAYWTKREFAGLYFPTSMHGRQDRVAVKTLFGTKQAPVITAPVPPQHAHLKQYAEGNWRYIEGDRP